MPHSPEHHARLRHSTTGGNGCSNRICCGYDPLHRIWMHYIRWQPPAELGAELQIHPGRVSTQIEIGRVTPNSATEAAGLRSGDIILAVNDRPVHDLSVPEAIARGRPGEVVSLLVKDPRVAIPLSTRVTLRARTRGARQQPTSAQLVAIQTAQFLSGAVSRRGAD